jgi:Domain of unknown function (DUF6475)
MRASDKTYFQALLTDAMAFYRQDLSTFALSVWWAACESFDLEQVRKALTAHAMDPEHGRFAPKPADVVRILQGTHTDRSLMAWAKLHRAIGRVGSWKSIVFDDPAIHAAVEDLGGWLALCSGTSDDLPFLQKRFCDAHKAYIKRPGHPYPPRIVGVFEATNGFACDDDVVLIGEREACLRVLAGGGEKPQIASLADEARKLVGAA